MKKLLVICGIVLLAGTAKAQFSGNLQLTRSSGVNIVGSHFTYLLGSDAFKVGPMIGVSKALVTGSSMSIDYGLQTRYYLAGDTDKGLYPELDLLGGRFNSVNVYKLGFGAGYKADSGTDFGFRWESNLNNGGGTALTFRVGIFF